ncbi:MAG: PEP-CTERM sorting domain-containing protein [Planctomycetota bacterium]
MSEINRHQHLRGGKNYQAGQSDGSPPAPAPRGRTVEWQSAIALTGRVVISPKDWCRNNTSSATPPNPRKVTGRIIQYGLTGLPVPLQSSQSVPEPSTMLLLSVGLFASGLRPRAKRS